MIEQPKCCATCKYIQDDSKYCHRRKMVRYNLLGDVDCKDHARKWRAGYKRDMLAWVGV